MEVLQAIIYTTRFILKNGNLDWYYIVAVIGVMWLIRRKCINQYLRIYVLSAVLLITMVVGSYFFAGIKMSLLDAGFSCIKILLCISIMLWAKESFLLVDLKKFLYIAVGIHAVETIIALLSVNDLLWRTNDITNGFYETRLQLFYMEPSELSMCSALLMILIYYLFETRGFSYGYIPCGIILGADMYLSAGMCGILSLGFAIGIVAVYKVIYGAVMKRKYIGLLIYIGIVIVLVLGVYFIDLPMIQRARLILSGKFGADSSMMWRLQVPLQLIFPILKNTAYMGVGLGNFNSDAVRLFLGALFGWANWFPNSFLYFIAEGGCLALITTVIGVGYLGFKTIKSHCISIMLLFCFIMIYQIPGGYFTNPLNWICYGIILSVCEKNDGKEKIVGHNNRISI